MEFVSFVEDLGYLVFLSFGLLGVDRIHVGMIEFVTDVRDQFLHPFLLEHLLDLVIDVLISGSISCGLLVARYSLKGEIEAIEYREELFKEPCCPISQGIVFLAFEAFSEVLGISEGEVILVFPFLDHLIGLVEFLFEGFDFGLEAALFLFLGELYRFFFLLGFFLELFSSEVIFLFCHSFSPFSLCMVLPAK